MSADDRPSNQESILHRLLHLQKFEWVKNHDTYNAGLTTREGRAALVEIERLRAELRACGEPALSAANERGVQVLTVAGMEALSKAVEVREERDRLRAALRRYGQHDKENDCIAGCLCGLDAALEAAPPAETTPVVGSTHGRCKKHGLWRCGACFPDETFGGLSLGDAPNPGIRHENGIAVCAWCGFAMVSNEPRQCCPKGIAYDKDSTYAR
jgi:hypothetical protein